ncbi:MAG: molybdopterin-dependent oxidoreductase [Candidatus Tectomicrobia bacterium]|nr:molybdopterin-dependent oxidoreductase [Candidatus Tectomicrobia bacterium]
MNASRDGTQTYRLKVNGKAAEVSGWDKRILMDVLRDDLRLTGTKNGCAQGYCGSCRVILNGKAVNACTTPLRVADGGEVVTIEGLGNPENPHPLQRAFAEYGACQCGFCIPGFIVSAAALLEKNPAPTVAEIREGLKENVCRCTGYHQIVEAVSSVADPASKAPVPESPGPSKRIGKSPARKDALAKACGAALYADDLYVDDMLHAAVLRSPHPHARLRSVDTAEAERLPGVRAVLTAKDVPHNRYGLITPDQPVLAEGKVRYAGEPVLAVAAESDAIAQEALKKIRVAWEALPGIFDPRESLTPEAPYVQDLEPEGQVIQDYGKNIGSRRRVNRGDVDRAFQECAAVCEVSVATQMVEHGYLEPEACLTYLEAHPQGGDMLVVRCAGQNIFADRRQISAALKRDLDRIRVLLPHCGGAFGGKEDVVPQILCALLTVKTGRPVKYVLSREESMLASTKRHPFWGVVKVGADASGRLQAAEVNLLGDTGAYTSVCDIVMTRGATHATGPYSVDNVRVDVVGAYTNNPISGAMRGFGTPQVAFAVEVAMDALAERLGIDPVEFRLRNALEPGKRTGTGQLLLRSVGLKECIRRAAGIAGWEEFRRNRRGEAENGGPWRRGMGIGLAFKNVGLGNASERDKGAAELDLGPGGRIRIRTGAAEVGQGMTTILCQLAAEALGVRYEQVDIEIGDTWNTPESGVSSASRQTFMTGNAVVRAAQGLKAQVLEAASEWMDVPLELLEVEEGVVRVKGAPGVSMTLREISDRAGDGMFKASGAYIPPPPTAGTRSAGKATRPMSRTGTGRRSPRSASTKRPVRSWSRGSSPPTTSAGPSTRRRFADRSKGAWSRGWDTPCGRSTGSKTASPGAGC